MNSRYAVLLSLLLCFAVAACSSSKTKNAANADEDAGLFASPDSSADDVDSIPEDALTSDENKDSTPSDMQAATPVEDKNVPAKEDLAKEDSVKTEVAPTDLNAPPMGTSTSAAAVGDLTSTEQATTAQVYVVQKGDTLMKIAFSLYGDLDRWKDLYEWNREKLKDGGNHLAKGVKLKYEDAGSKFEQEKLSHAYEIKKGDSLARIAEDLYGRKMKYKKLQKYNAKLIKNPNVIFAGFTLYYDITNKEVAEAEAHRQEKLAKAGGGRISPASSDMPTMPMEAKAAPVIPSVINPAPVAVVPTTPAPVATAPAPVPTPVPLSPPPAPMK